MEAWRTINLRSGILRATASTAPGRDRTPACVPGRPPGRRGSARAAGSTRAVGRAQRPVRVIEQHPLDLPHIPVAQPPVVVAHQRRDVHDDIAGDAAGEIDVRIHVAARERARVGEHRPAAVKARVARPGNRSPASVAPVDEDHVVELVDRFEAEKQRRVAVLLRGPPPRTAPPRGNGRTRAGRRRGSCAGWPGRRAPGCRAAR